jgi:drug/metabolite transporter (DMT)-like permease
VKAAYDDDPTALATVFWKAFMLVPISRAANLFDRPRVAIVVIAACWGTAFMFVKIAATAGMPPLAIAAARGLLAGAFLALWLMLRRGTHPPRAPARSRMVRDVFVLALFNGILPNVLVAFALQRIDSAPAAIIQASVPLIVVVLGFAQPRGDRPSRMQVMGLMLGFLGVFTVIGPMTLLGAAATASGTSAMLGAAASYAVVTVYLRQARPADIALVSFAQQVVSGVVAAALAAAWAAPHASNWPPSPSTWAALVGLAVLSTVVPMLMYFRLLRSVPAAQAALVQYLLPLAATAYAVVLLGETVRPEALAGGVMVLAGVYVASRQAVIAPASKH